MTTWTVSQREAIEILRTAATRVQLDKRNRLTGALPHLRNALKYLIAVYRSDGGVL